MIKKYNKNVVRMIKSCASPKWACMCPFFLFIDTWDGMQSTDWFLKGVTICKAIEAFQGIILFKRESLRSKLKFFRNKPVMSNHGQALLQNLWFQALQNSTLWTHISGVRRTILKCKVCAFKLKIDKYAYELKKSPYLIVLFPCSVKRGYFF